MRRKQCAITDPESISEILRRCTVGRLATIGVDGYPYITPLNFVYSNGSIYFHCARKGEKTDNILRNPKVCFEVDIPLAYLGTDFDDQYPACQVHQFYHSVIIRGNADIIEDIDEKVMALNAMMATHENRPDFSEITAATPAVSACSVVAVCVDSITAKSDLAQKKSDEQKQQIAEYLTLRNLPGDKEAADLIRPGA
ncbi:pyridoxamine 5'-phosphate oxidase family protein [Desulfosediminicola flagellatus]|uniref:pyridoxamine 5'-phosphate oxidase family protein n=1 Tax=Desulfosediminicola flagellatus TaxID=2569541 RepID=UPI0010AD95E2|nr:pyridoxamine 5'-phosphate oxidase family protein [Desulfosediminicola flagellatus]